MHPIELMKYYKTAYTPMSEDSDILHDYYKRNEKETRFSQRASSFVIVTRGQPTSTWDAYLSEMNDVQYMELYSKFLFDWHTNQSHFPNFKKSFVFENIKVVIDRFLALNPNYITFDLTKDCSVFFQALVNGKNIYLELYFANDVKNGLEAITNIYQDGECVFAYGGSVEDAMAKVFSMVKESFSEPTQSAYDISQSAFASTQL